MKLSTVIVTIASVACGGNALRSNCPSQIAQDHYTMLQTPISRNYDGKNYFFLPGLTKCMVNSGLSIVPSYSLSIKPVIDYFATPIIRNHVQRASSAFLKVFTNVPGYSPMKVTFSSNNQSWVAGTFRAQKLRDQGVLFKLPNSLKGKFDVDVKANPHHLPCVYANPKFCGPSGAEGHKTVYIG